MKSKSLLPLLRSGFVLAALITALPAQTTPTPTFAWKLEPGLSYSRGDYGLASDTEVWSAPVALSYDSGNVVLRGSVAWLTLEGPATVSGGTAIPTRPTTARKSGYGDFSAGLTYKLAHEPGQWNVNLGGRVKFATASVSKGLGTGKNDYFAQVDLLKSYDAVTPYLTAGYRWLGDSATFQLQDGPFAAAGLAFPVDSQTTFSVGGEWRRAIVRGSDDAKEVSAALFHRFNERWSLSLNSMMGLNDASAELGAGASLGYSF